MTKKLPNSSLDPSMLFRHGGRLPDAPSGDTKPAVPLADEPAESSGTARRRPARRRPDSNAVRYKSGSRNDHYPRQDGAKMIKTTFHATFELVVALASYTAILPGRNARNAWMEDTLMAAIRKECGQEWIDAVIAMAEKKESRAG